jgi:hypothetical protein
MTSHHRTCYVILSNPSTWRQHRRHVTSCTLLPDYMTTRHGLWRHVFYATTTCRHSQKTCSVFYQAWCHITTCDVMRSNPTTWRHFLEDVTPCIIQDMTLHHGAWDMFSTTDYMTSLYSGHVTLWILPHMTSQLREHVTSRVLRPTTWRHSTVDMWRCEFYHRWRHN